METNNSIHDLLEKRQAIDSSIIELYGDKIERVFQIYFETTTKLNITRITHIAPSSNFVVVFASAFLKAGETIKSGAEPRVIEYDVNIMIDFFLPVYLMDSGTPYQICDILKNLLTIKSMCSDADFHLKLKDPTFLADDPYSTIREISSQNTQTELILDQYDGVIGDFNVTDLDEQQRKNLILSLLNNSTGEC